MLGGDVRGDGMCDGVGGGDAWRVPPRGVHFREQLNSRCGSPFEDDLGNGVALADGKPTLSRVNQENRGLMG